MKFLFVKSNKWGSRLIRWALRDESSHFAVCFDEQAKGSGIVFHSVGSGAVLEWFGAFRKTHTLVSALSFKAPLILSDEESIYQGMLAEYSGEGYDFKAVLFWAWRALLLRFFGKPLPAKNYWAAAGYNLCTGLAGGLKWVEQWANDNRVDLEMIGPGDLYRRLLATGYFVDEKEWCALQNSPQY